MFVTRPRRTQVTIDSLKNELREAQQLRAKDAEKHRREETRLQERHEALIRFSKVCPILQGSDRVTLLS